MKNKARGMDEMQKNNVPLVTIAIPTYKRKKLLLAAVESALTQTNIRGIDYEVIVVDNEAGGEENETEQALTKYLNKVRYYKNPKNLGMIGNWNQCLKLARGKWVAFLHDDDMLDNNYTDAMCYYVDKYKEAKCIIPNRREVDETGELLHNSKRNRRNQKIPIKLNMHKAWKVKDIDNKVMNFNFYGPPSCGVCIDRECALRAGGFNEADGIIAADWEFFIRFSRIYNIYKLNEVLGSYRWAVNTTLQIQNSVQKELIEKTYFIFEKIYDYANIKNKIYKKFVKLNLSMVSWEWCRNCEDASKYTEQKVFSKAEVLQFYIWAFCRRIYMYFREAFVER